MGERGDAGGVDARGPRLADPAVGNGRLALGGPLGRVGDERSAGLQLALETAAVLLFTQLERPRVRGRVVRVVRDDPEGAAQRILSDDYDDKPKS